ncbi:DUF2795 domain-containing protein [Streptomyces sp. ODS28]|uniref:DUF2795 domain-containing protein n=1 Tax=Streptomyces sp. ODS28 TaxID=3136688 RepID=UPI0031E59A02
MTENFGKSNALNVHRDDEAKREMQGRLRHVYPTRAEEWNDPEPGADDDPELAEGPVPAAGTADPQESADEALRFDLARHLGRTTFPADRDGVLRTLEDAHAPEPLVDTARGLPEDGGTYRNVQEVVTALGRRPRV